MKITESDKIKHRKLQNEGDLQKISAEQKTYADVCASLVIQQIIRFKFHHYQSK